MGGRSGGLLSKLMNPMKMLKKLMQMPRRMMGGLMGGNRPAVQGAGGARRMNPMSIIQGIIGGMGQRGM